MAPVSMSYLATRGERRNGLSEREWQHCSWLREEKKRDAKRASGNKRKTTERERERETGYSMAAMGARCRERSADALTSVIFWMLCPFARHGRKSAPASCSPQGTSSICRNVHFFLWSFANVQRLIDHPFASTAATHSRRPKVPSFQDYSYICPFHNWS